MKWPKVKLGAVLKHRKEFIQIDDLAPYKRCRVQLHAQGVVLRDQVPGSDIKTKKQQVCKAGEFLVAEIDAKHGGYGMVPDDLEGAIVSSHYFLFGTDDAKIDRRYLGWFVRTPAFFEQVAAQGSTNYAAIRPGHVLEYEVPLPPLAEQRRLVASIDALATKIDEAKRLHGEATEGSDRLLICMAHRRDWPNERKASAGWTQVNLGDVVTLRPAPVKVDTAAQYPNLGIYSFARGLFEKPPIEGLATSASTLFRVRAGQFIYSRLFAFEGAYGVVPDDLDGRYVSNEYPTFDCDESRVLPEFLEAHFKSPQVWQEVAVGSKGLGDRRQRVQPEQVLTHKMWLPPMAWQRTIAETRKRLAAERANKSLVESQLDAMLPAILDRAFRGEL